MENKKLTPQHKTILQIHSNGEFHCSTEIEYIRDQRKRVSELNQEGFMFEAKPCDGRCGLKHNARLFMRRLTRLADWFSWDMIGQELPQSSGPRSSQGPERIAFDRRPEKMRTHEWVFESKSHPGKKYHVVDFTTFYSCECDSYTYRKTCKHIEEVKKLQARPEKTTQARQGQLI